MPMYRRYSNSSSLMAGGRQRQNHSSQIIQFNISPGPCCSPCDVTKSQLPEPSVFTDTLYRRCSTGTGGKVEFTPCGNMLSPEVMFAVEVPLETHQLPDGRHLQNPPRLHKDTPCVTVWSPPANNLPADWPVI